jgi:hypothetical protein
MSLKQNQCPDRLTFLGQDRPKTAQYFLDLKEKAAMHKQAGVGLEQSGQKQVGNGGENAGSRTYCQSTIPARKQSPLDEVVPRGTTYDLTLASTLPTLANTLPGTEQIFIL